MTRMAARIERRGLRSVDRVFVENAWMYERLCREIGSELVVLAPPGVDTERFRPPPGPPPGPAPILAVGRFSDPRKRVDLLFDAYALLCKRDVATPPLLLAGASAPSAADWAQAEGLGIRARIEMREHVRDDELLELYRGARLLVLCSDEEGLGLVLLEAMACGLPVVATDCGGPRTLVVHGETGLLTPSGDAVRLADALGSLLGDTERCRRLGAAARARAVERFSLRTASAPFLAWCDEPARTAPH
jgi:glycosyltransferase involved in cell wall biosynthesis